MTNNNQAQTIQPCDQVDYGLACLNSDTSSEGSCSTPSLISYKSLVEGRNSPYFKRELPQRCKFERRRCFGLWKTNTERWFMRAYFFISLIALFALVTMICYRLSETESSHITCPKAGKTCTTVIVQNGAGRNTTIQMCTGAVSTEPQCFAYTEVECTNSDEFQFNP